MAREQYCRKVLILANLLKPVPRFCNEQKQNAFGEKKTSFGKPSFFLGLELRYVWTNLVGPKKTLFCILAFWWPHLG